MSSNMTNGTSGPMPGVSGLAGPYNVAMGTIIFIVTWIFMAFKIPRYPIGRTLGTMAGAAAIVVFQVLAGSDAYAAINIETLALLFGTMVMTVLLEREGFFQMVVRLLVWKCKSPMSLLMRICIISGVLSALVTNDTSCVFLTPIVAEICHQYELPYGPFLIALGSSSNLGSTATPVGNPQNMIIALLSGLTYGQFIIYIGPATIVCMALNMLFLFLRYRRQLSTVKLDLANSNFDAKAAQKRASLSQHPPAAGEGPKEVQPEAVDLGGSSATGAGAASTEDANKLNGSSLDSAALPDLDGLKPAEPQAWMPGFMPECLRPVMTKIAGHEKLASLIFVLFGTVVAFTAGAPLGWASVAGCVVMLLIDAREPDKTLSGVDWGLLVFFTSLFIVVQGFRMTGIPSATWNAVHTFVHVQTGSGLLLYALVVVLGSNTVSNVPLVLLLAGDIQLLGDWNAAWLLLSFISTVAGNLTLVGSVALLIVCERSKHRYVLTFWEYFQFGFPTTVLQVIIGCTIMFNIMPYNSSH